MSQTASPLSRSPFQSDTDFNPHRSHPMPRSRPNRGATPKQEDRMDITTPPRASPRLDPPSNDSPEAEHDMSNSNSKRKTSVATPGPNEQPPTTNGVNNSNTTLSAAAAATSTQGKVVQTAFIHKLYNMLEDQSISHLIAWSSTNDSFVMSPSQDFSKALSQYFKHTNISSFVRQLNMYGFHKVSDVFHTGAPDSALWEFKHGQGNFKRGDLNGLREIKRRASRHALIQRESFSSPHRPSVSQPGTPAEPLPEAPPSDPRFANIDSTIWELHARLSRTEESNSALSSKCAYLSESLVKCQQWNNELAQIMMKMVPDQENPLHREIAAIQKDVARHSEMVRAHEDPHESLLSGRQPYFGQMALESAPLSPRQAAPEERRPSLHGPPGRSNYFRHPATHAALSPRRYGSIGNSAHVPSHHRPPINVPAPQTPTHQPHPLASVTEPGHGSVSGPNLARRHTSADIRDTAGWPPQGVGQNSERGPYENNQAPSSSTPQWPPSSPGQPDPQAQNIREQFGSFDFGQSRRSTVIDARSRGSSPPPPHVDPNAPPHQQQPAPPPPIQGPFQDNSWSFQGASSNKLVPRFAHDASAPNTRRSSMASNVHNLLNPAGDGDAKEREEDPSGPDDRNKRKRMA